MIFCVVLDDYGDRWEGIYLCSHCWCCKFMLVVVVVVVVLSSRRACALRALGLLQADGTPTVGGGKTF